MSAYLAQPDDADPTTAELVAARPHLSLHAMDGLLMDGVPLNAIADAVGSPTWVLSASCLRGRLRALQDAMAGLPMQVHYAVKANDHLAVLRLMAQGGAGADVVSGGELQRALLAGIPAGDIVFSGVGKSAADLRLALAAGVGQINAESAEELAMLSALASSMGRTARVALRINPDVDAGTHAKITTGRAGNKFGIAYDEAAALYAHATALPGLDPVGIALHIGSQILSMAPYRAGQRVQVVDCGGGLGIPYRNEPAASPAALAGAVRATLGGLDVRLATEPGRWLAGPAGVLLTSVVLSKTTAGRRFVVLDAAMNDLARPAMYDAWHGIVPVSAVDAVRAVSQADIVGPVCETGDTFARARALPALAPNARLAILDAGAYGSVMSSTYNARPLAAEVMVDGSRWSVIRTRQPVEALWAAESIPDWLR